MPNDSYRLGSGACAVEGSDASHPHDRHPHSVSSAATSLTHQALIRINVIDRQGNESTPQVQVESRAKGHVTDKGSATNRRLQQQGSLRILPVSLSALRSWDGD